MFRVKIKIENAEARGHIRRPYRTTKWIVITAEDLKTKRFETVEEAEHVIEWHKKWCEENGYGTEINEYMIEEV